MIFNKTPSHDEGVFVSVPAKCFKVYVVMTKSNASLSEEDKHQLEILIDDSVSTITKENKFKIQSGYKNYFLPPFEEMMSFLNIKCDLSALYKHAEVSGISLPQISHGSLHQLHHQGVGKGVYKKLINTLISLPSFPTQSLIKDKDQWIDRSDSANSNALSWFGGIYQYNFFKTDKNLDQHELAFYQYLMTFIEQRCQQDIAYLEQRNNKIEDLMLPKVNPCFSNHTQIDNVHLVVLEEVLSEAFDINLLDEKKKIAIIEASLTCEYDFLFNCIACYEVGYMVTNNLLNIDSDNKKAVSTIYLMMDHYTQLKNDETCFHSFWKVIQLTLKDNGIDLSNRKLASFIQINQHTDSFNSLNDAQYNVLKKWFKQQDLPSNDKLRSFVDSFAESIGFGWTNHFLLMAKIALGFDTLLNQKSEQVKNSFGSDIDVTAIWKRVLGRYSEYYLYYFHQHFSGK